MINKIDQNLKSAGIMKTQPLCSIIIRTKNEERWISACLSAVYEQTYNNFEVIIVDNDSVDKTIDNVRKFPISKILNISEYLPGKSLNIGIKEAAGDYIVCLSGHCIPINNQWLEFLVDAIIENENYAGVYGRQEPMSFSSDADKRDLLLTFGLDKRIQIKDSFFHNANSIIRKKYLDEVPFDDNITNIEDRIWAQKIIEKGCNIVYEPKASVYHYHGIHQDGDQERCTNIVKIIENFSKDEFSSGSINPEKLRINALIPVKGRPIYLGGVPQIKYTIDAAKNSKYIDKVFVITDDKETMELAYSFGAECPFKRPDNLSKKYVSLEAVFQYAIESLEGYGVLSDLVVTLEPTFPFRQSGLIDNIIDHTLSKGLDSVIAAISENGSIWREGDDSYTRIDSGDSPRAYKEKTLIGLRGVCCVTHPVFLRNGRILGDKVGLYEVDNQLCSIEIRDNKTLVDPILIRELSKSMGSL
jgi:rhamnosyltransferase